MSKTLWCADVIKDLLKDRQQCPDTVYCWAESSEEAQHILKNANWPEAYWVEDKSVCRLRKLYQVFSPDCEGIDRKSLEPLLSKEVLRQLPVEQLQCVTVEDRKQKASRPKVVTDVLRRRVGISIQELQTTGRTQSTTSPKRRRRASQPAPAVTEMALSSHRRRRTKT